MSKIIIKNTALGTISELVLRISKLFFISIIAKNFSQTEFGKYTYAISFLSFFAVFFDTGLLNIYLREATENLKNITNINFFLFKILASILGYIFLLIIAIVKLPSSSVSMIGWLGLYNLSNEFISFFLVPLKAKNNYEKEAFIRSGSILIPTLIAIFSIFLSKDLESVIKNMSLSTFFILIICFFLSSNFKFHFSKNLINLKEIFLEVLPITITTFLGAFYTNFDTIILASRNGLESVAIYSVSTKLVLGLSIIPIAFLNYSLQTSFGVKKWDFETSKKWLYGQKLTFNFGLFIVILLNILAKPIVLIIFGEKYLDSIVFLNLYSIVTLLYYSYQPIIQLLIMRKDQIKTTFSLVLAGLINYICLKMLVPPFAIYGAVISAIITHFLILILLTYFGNNHFKSVDYFKKTIFYFFLKILALFNLSLFLIYFNKYYLLSILLYTLICLTLFMNPLKELIVYTNKYLLKRN